MSKILVIDSEALISDLYLEYLNAERFDVIGAENGIIGVNKAQEELPDLIISDIRMPELDGYGILKALRENPITAIIPFIFHTKKASKDDIRKGMVMGADDYLIKPSTVKELLDAIKAQLKKQANIKKWCADNLLPAQKLRETEINISNIPQISFSSNPKLRKVFDFIEANYHRQITPKDVAHAVGYSSAYLSKLVRCQTGQTLQKWIIHYRMSAAKNLLIKTSETVEQIAESVGYQHSVHFFRQFRLYNETTPKAWRKAHSSHFQLDNH